VLYFGIPVATPGVRVVCREPFTHEDAQDHRLSAFFDEMDAWMVFDNVFIPNDRVFFLDRPDLNFRIFSAIPSAWAFYHMLIRQAVKAEVLAGICASVCDYMGTTSQPPSQAALADAIGYVETLRAFLFAAEHQPVFSSFGLAIPGPIQTIQGRIHFMERHGQMLQLVRDICGSALLMAPGEADMTHPEIGELVRHFLGADDPRASDRFRMMKLAWEYTGDSFGTRQFLFELYNGGTMAVNRMRLVNSYDLSPMVRLAKDVAGIRDEG
jgi:aromatic ring hydroxylase